MKDLQVENGNFTRIINPLIDELIKIPFKGCELAVVLFIIRKTYGFQKKQDEISLTQFEKGLDRSRQTIVTALKNLQLVNVVRLVKQGSSRNSSNLWEINKYIDTWKLVNMARLVQRKRGTSLTNPPQLVYTARHTKENKRNTKETSELGSQVNKVFSIFEKINPTLNWGNKTTRSASEFMIKKFGLEATLKMAEQIIAVQGNPYAPVATTPYQMKEKLAQFKVYFDSLKNKQEKSSVTKIS